MTAAYGDADPLDAYDAGDPIHVRLLVLARAAADLTTPGRRAELVRLLDVVTTDLVAGRG
jgi:hypothetical protein